MSATPGPVLRGAWGRGLADPWYAAALDTSSAVPLADIPTGWADAEPGQIDEAASRLETARRDRADWITRRFFQLCEHPRTRERTLAAVRSSAGEAVAGRLLIGIVGRLLKASLGRSRRVDDSAVTAELVAAQLAGIAVLRYVTEAEPIASLPVEDLVARVAPAVRATLSG